MQDAKRTYSWGQGRPRKASWETEIKRFTKEGSLMTKVHKNMVELLNQHCTGKQEKWLYWTLIQTTSLMTTIREAHLFHGAHKFA